jgi:O-antigen ligase
VFVTIPIVVSSLISKQKILGFFLLALIAVGLFVSIPAFEYLSGRVEETMLQAKTWDLQGITHGRYTIWKETLSKPNRTWLLFGEGLTHKEGERHTHAHNNYIGILKHMGCIGILFWIVYYTKLLKKSIWLMKHDPIYNMSAIFRGVFWVYIGYFVFFMTCTPIQWIPVRYIDFFLMTLLYLRYRQIETEQEYSIEDELYPEQPDYDQVY